MLLFPFSIITPREQRRQHNRGGGPVCSGRQMRGCPQKVYASVCVLACACLRACVHRTAPSTPSPKTATHVQTTIARTRTQIVAPLSLSVCRFVGRNHTPHSRAHRQIIIIDVFRHVHRGRACTAHTMRCSWRAPVWCAAAGCVRCDNNGGPPLCHPLCTTPHHTTPHPVTLT